MKTTSPALFYRWIDVIIYRDEIDILWFTFVKIESSVKIKGNVFDISPLFTPRRVVVTEKNRVTFTVVVEATN